MQHLKVFKTSNDLKLHTIRHSDLRPYHCVQCDRKFKTISDLKEHNFTHTDQRPYHCGQCDKKYKRPRDLKIHSFSHIKERPYCDNCNASCDQLRQLSSDGKDELPLICSSKLI
uniref:Protein krueppel-like n=1 Tax=Dermatophagoides pteronyssinus TaxID=6956 RepID=A0A6P6XW57_DERPT|nr:protein krueppel-like [Dermatophagoides pteronyssinus]